ncbi:type III secretion system translocon subunit SctE [Chlamydia pecorum]|uniref:type III secretion system translocon subunit SctE n=1 Tax=Chlamydia pecorum TaxID=85991 RepID=UPI0007AFC693|nr:type III secretion system translocon subunit SctE [Chlamydia pecorum]KZN28080.1 secretion system effector C (SseC) like family protein [Chlamydia pecorum]
MTSGVSGTPSQDPSLAAQLAQNARGASEAAAGKTKDAKKAGAEEAAGFEDLIQETTTEGTGKKEKTSQSSKSSKTSKSEKASGTSSSSTVTSASKTATHQAIQATKLGTSNYELPQLPSPESTMINGAILRKGKGTLALLGQIMALLAEASGKSWSASFQQQNQAIQSQAEMAPLIGEAIRSQANSQAAATEAQAKQSLISGIVNIVGFGLTVGIGAASALKSGASSLKAASFTKETGGAASAATSSALSSATQSAQQTATAAAASAGGAAAKTAANLTDDMAAAATKSATSGGGIFGKMLNTPKWSEKASRGLNVVKQQGARAAQFGSKVLGASMQAAQMMHAVTAGIEGITGGIIGAQVAQHQRDAGMAEAKAEELKQMSSIYSQYAGQAGQLQEQAYSSFREALQTIQNVADSQTQTTSAIFN